MVLCVIALIVFGILGIFSASHREYAKEAFNCVFRKATFRPCNTDFNKKLKVKASLFASKINKSFQYPK